MTSVIFQPCAAVTMADAMQGDAFVVDLRVAKNFKQASSWNRFIIDTGPGLKNTTNIVGGGPFAALKRAILDIDPEGKPHITLPGPWKQGRPLICGMIITHSDSDHWENAREVVDLLKDLYKKEYGKNTTATENRQKVFVLNPFPIYTSPMVQFAKELQSLHVPEKLKRLQPFNEDPEQYRRLESFKYVLILDQRRYKELHKAGRPFAEIKQAKVARVSVGVRWVHTEVGFSVERSFSDVFDLAKHLGYGIQYRFNVLKPLFRLDERPNLHRTLTDEWINEHTLTKERTWTEHSIFQPTDEILVGLGYIDKDGNLVNDQIPRLPILGECRLVPPPRNAKRSYTVGPGDPNQVIGGYWLRASGLICFSDQHEEWDTGDEVIMSKADSSGEMLLEGEPNVDNGKGMEEEERVLTPQEKEKVEIDAIMPPLKTDNTRYDGVELFEDVACLGYQDRIYPLKFSTKDSFYKATYAGCAGTRFSRDFLHMAVQHSLSQLRNDAYWVLTGKREEREKWREQNEEWKILKEKKRMLTNIIDHTPEPQNVEKEKKELEDVETKIKKIRKTYDDTFKKVIRDASKATEQHPEWAHAANRASLITHFRFEKTTLQNHYSFDMLFTGDAFELGASDKAPYAPHLRMTNKDFGNPLAIRPKTIERPDRFLANPDGNLLTWLWQHSGLNGIRVGVLKVPHHGSSTTTNALFYRLVSASVYLISGSNSRFGHPRAETLAAIIDTIMREDGDAKPPSAYSSKAKPDEDGLMPDIRHRKRPRLIFATYSTCKKKRLMVDDRRKEEKRILDQINESTAGKGPVGDTMALNDKNAKPAEDDEEKVVRDDNGDEDDDDEDDPESKKKKRETKSGRGYADIQDFVYFHSRYLGGFGDRPTEDGERLRRKRNEQDPFPEDKPARANVRIFVQKKQSAATRLLFGFDRNQSDQLRVEWLESDWDEIRADKQPESEIDDPEIRDPVAYPRPGELPDWEADYYNRAPPLNRDDFDITATKKVRSNPVYPPSGMETENGSQVKDLYLKLERQFSENWRMNDNSQDSNNSFLFSAFGVTKP